MQQTKTSGQPGQVSSGMVKRSLAMEIPEYDLPTSAGVYKQLYAYGNYIDEVVYASCSGATYTMRRYLHDHLYSPAAIVYLTAGNCILVERSEYDAYGAAHYYNADYTQTFAVSQHGNPFAFTGREIDSFDFAAGVPQLTKMHYRHRDYSPFMGRFYQEDMYGVNPAGSIFNNFQFKNQYKDGLNIYQYIQGDPINNQDSFGLSETATKFWICYRMTETTPKLPAHAYLFFGESPWGKKPNGEGWGFSGGTEAKEEQFFNPYKCRKCENSGSRFRKLNYGSSKGKSCRCATDDDIWSCIKAYPPRKQYSVPFYVCLHYAEEAKQQCCLKCDITSTRPPASDEEKE